MAAQSGIKHIEIVVGIRGVQSGPDTGKTGVGNGSGSQTGVRIGVVGAVDLQILRGQIGLATQSIDNGSIDV